MRLFTPSALCILLRAFTAASATLTVNSTEDDLTSESLLTLCEAVVLIDHAGVTSTVCVI